LIALACVALYPSHAAAQANIEGGRTVLAAVVNAQGRPIVDIGVDDVVVSEAGSSRDVVDVHVADYPLSIVLDDREVSSATLETLRESAQRFVKRVGERPIALVRLSDGSHAAVGLDDERATLLERIAEFVTGPAVTPPLDTIARAAALLKDTDAPFSAVIVIAAEPVDASALVRGELLPQIIESGAAVHVVQLQTPSASAVDDPGVPDLLKVIADQTKGQFTPIFSAASFGAALDRLADRLAVEMMIQYMVPPGPKAGDVQIGVRKPGSRVIGLGVK
jgi:hypothetical protein